jgi:hypothetical protein
MAVSLKFTMVPEDWSSLGNYPRDQTTFPLYGMVKRLMAALCRLVSTTFRRVLREVEACGMRVFMDMTRLCPSLSVRATKSLSI